MKTMTDKIKALEGKKVHLRIKSGIVNSQYFDYHGELRLSEPMHGDRYVNVGREGICPLSDITVVAEKGGETTIVARD